MEVVGAIVLVETDDVSAHDTPLDELGTRNVPVVPAPAADPSREPAQPTPTRAHINSRNSRRSCRAARRVLMA
jgi:hypothetical protein